MTRKKIKNSGFIFFKTLWASNTKRNSLQMDQWDAIIIWEG